MSNVYIYSVGEFAELPADFLKDKAIVRIFNAKDEGWQGNDKFENFTQYYFDDIKPFQIRWFERLDLAMPYLGINSILSMFSDNEKSKLFSKEDGKKLADFIKKNKKRDFIIHCQFGRSRSVAVGLFIQDAYKAKIVNKTPAECENYNNWVYTQLVKNFKS